MRLITALLMSALCASVYAAEAPQPAPVPPPPAMDTNEAVDEPQVTITKETEQTIEEYRVGGKLYMIKVTPKHGKPYFMVDDRGDGKFARQDSLDTGFRPPQWVIHRF